ncbi:hypothetical protein OPT61_g9871 [Boeremia exigua]|uniref:Uncharacterized protein n=1 Tax=Boeremia exigua TaxID=749465 RepID=A0ACC2HSM1_9PLEO|nr:hypothetical protein OPT61_g9871 [Boeremia exigua]
MLLRMGALRGLLDFFGAPVAGRIANVTLFPFVFAFFGAGRFAGALPLFLRRRSRNSSSSGSPSVLSSSSSDVCSSASSPLSLSSPRFLFEAPAGLAPGVNFSGFFVTRPDFRRALDEVASPVSAAATAALMVTARYMCANLAENWCSGEARRVELAASCGDAAAGIVQLVRVAHQPRLRFSSSSSLGGINNTSWRCSCTSTCV